jgi:hypothetical protein
VPLELFQVALPGIPTSSPGQWICKPSLSVKASASTASGARRLAAPRYMAVGLLILMTVAGCRRGVPAVDTSPTPGGAAATINGTVRGALGAGPVDGRLVDAVNVETGETQRVSTDTAGAFSFKLKPGRYRVELALRAGESVVRRPGIIDVNGSDAGVLADFVVGTVRVSRPRGPAYRIDDGLGSPIA